MQYNMGRRALHALHGLPQGDALHGGVMHRMMQHVMGGWAAVRRQKREGSTRPRRSCCAALGASRPVGAWRCGGASALRASSSASRARWRHSSARRAGQQEARRGREDPVHRNHRAINAAKILIQKERENQAATKIQTNYRNHLAINAAKVMIREKRRQAAERLNLAAA